MVPKLSLIYSILQVLIAMNKPFCLHLTEGTKDSSSLSLDFQGFTNVVVRSVKELHNLVAVAQRRSKNWTENQR